MMATMRKAITVIYDYFICGEWERRMYTATTYEDWHRVVRVLHEHTDIYKVVKVERA